MTDFAKTKLNFKKNKWILFLIIALGISCTNVPDDIDVTLDTAQNGMIQGKVVIPDIENNKLIWMGYSGATITLENTSFSTMTGTGGIYAIDGIPTGSYVVKATPITNLYYSDFVSDTKSVVVTRQGISTVDDLQLVPSESNDNPLILYGKIYFQDKVTPFANKQISLRTYTSPSMNGLRNTYNVTTSSDGSYGVVLSGNTMGMYCKFYPGYHSGENYQVWFINPDKQLISLQGNGIMNRDAFIII